MSDYKFPHVEVVKYHARQIRTFCKEHRCATCPFHTDMGCSFLRNSPYEWKGLEDNDGHKN